MRNGCCHKHGGTVRRLWGNQNAVTHGKRRWIAVQDSPLWRQIMALSRIVRRAVKKAHRDEMSDARAALAARKRGP
jgi:hypothetical protein